MLAIATGCALIAFVDIALGLVIAHLLGRAWYGGPDIWVYAAGPLLALLPDADFLLQPLVERLRGRKLVCHRQIIHYPLALVPIFFAVYWYHPFAAWLTVLCTGAHFVHDSVGNAYGIQWFWPFSSRHVTALTADPDGRRRIVRFRPHREVLAAEIPPLRTVVRERYLGLTPEVARALDAVTGALMLLAA